ncbi:ROK family protein [Agromyces sp. G08B096]|uniref:ROK family protein n=1 Tax=Agromyces sp. G08B096 TaxID=3156399 RepID=A0AAU7W8M0_9MICO
MRSVAIDLGGTSVKLGLVVDGVIESVSELPVSGGVDLAEVAAAVDALRGREAVDADAVGIAVPGVVDRGGRRLVAAHGKYADLHGVDLCAWSAARFGVAAIVENDARAALAGEIASGAASGAADAVLLTLGTGIGTAALVDGRLLRGRHGHAGVLNGHVTVDLDGPRCPCGNIGCAEAVASTWALAEAARRGDVALGPELEARRSSGAALGIRDLVETAHEAESAVLLSRFLDVWAAVAVTLCHAFDPEVVVVTGGVLRAADLILPGLRDRVHAHLWSSSFRPPLVAADDPATSVLRGLAALASAQTHEGHR